MDIKTFEEFLESQRDGFGTFLKGCKDLNREHMRVALATHSSKMTFALATALPILGVGPGIASPYEEVPQRSGRRSVTTPFKSPVSANSLRTQSPPASTRSFKSPSAISDIPLLFKRKTSTAAATPTNTPKLKKSADPESSSKASPYGSIRTSGGNHNVIRGGTIGGAAQIFKRHPSTPTGKRYTPDDDSSASSPPPSDDSYTNERHSRKRTASAKSIKSTKSGKSYRTDMTPKSPFELAAREAESKKPYVDSESTSDFDIPLDYPTIGIRKVNSAKSQKEIATPKKGSDCIPDYDNDDDAFAEDQETPSKKQKTNGRGSTAIQNSTVEIDLT